MKDDLSTAYFFIDIFNAGPYEPSITSNITGYLQNFGGTI